MQEKIHNAKIKIVCRLTENLQCQQEVFLDNQPCTSRPDAVCGAELFLNAFDPETQLQTAEKKLDSRNVVLVFRTSEAQMQEFCRIPEIQTVLHKQMQSQ